MTHQPGVYVPFRALFLVYHDFKNLLMSASFKSVRVSANGFFMF